MAGSPYSATVSYSSEDDERHAALVREVVRELNRRLDAAWDAGIDVTMTFDRDLPELIGPYRSRARVLSVERRVEIGERDPIVRLPD